MQHGICTLSLPYLHLGTSEGTMKGKVEMFRGPLWVEGGEAELKQLGKK